VVLPFLNLSDDPEQEYLADGITDDLTTDLSRIAGSFVIARNGAFTYKGKPAEVKKVGQELGVRYVLEGSVRRVSDRVRVNAQPIDAANGAHVWANRVDREMGDLLALQDDITGGIARALRYEPVAAESRRSLRDRPNNPRAADLVLRGVAIQMRDPLRPVRNGREARVLFEEALRIDPKLLGALTGLATTWLNEVIHVLSDEDERMQILAKAEELIERAEALAPEDARVLALRGGALTVRRQSEAAVEYCERAHARDPNSTQNLANLGWVKVFAGRPEEAIVHVEQALRLDPRGFNKGNWHAVLGNACQPSPALSGAARAGIRGVAARRNAGIAFRRTCAAGAAPACSAGATSP
jgi:TolB-like protein